MTSVIMIAPLNAANFESGNAPNTHALFSDGEGGSEWRAPAGGGGGSSVVARYAAADTFLADSQTLAATIDPLVIPAGALGTNKQARLSLDIRTERDDAYPLSCDLVLNGTPLGGYLAFYSNKVTIHVRLSNIGLSNSQVATIQLFGDMQATMPDEGVHQEIAFARYDGLTVDSTQAVSVGLIFGMGNINDLVQVYSAILEVI